MHNGGIVFVFYSFKFVATHRETKQKGYLLRAAIIDRQIVGPTCLYFFFGDVIIFYAIKTAHATDCAIAVGKMQMRINLHLFMNFHISFVINIRQVTCNTTLFYIS